MRLIRYHGASRIYRRQIRLRRIPRNHKINRSECFQCACNPGWKIPAPTQYRPCGTGQARKKLNPLPGGQTGRTQ